MMKLYKILFLSFISFISNSIFAASANTKAVTKSYNRANHLEAQIHPLIRLAANYSKTLDQQTLIDLIKERSHSHGFDDLSEEFNDLINDAFILKASHFGHSKVLNYLLFNIEEDELNEDQKKHLNRFPVTSLKKALSCIKTSKTFNILDNPFRILINPEEASRPLEKEALANLLSSLASHPNFKSYAMMLEFDSKSPIEVASKNGHLSCLKSMLLAIRSLPKSGNRALIQSGNHFHPSFIHAKIYSAIVEACTTDKVNSLKILIEERKILLKEISKAEGYIPKESPLTTASMGGSINCVKLILEETSFISTAEVEAKEIKEAFTWSAKFIDENETYKNETAEFKEKIGKQIQELLFIYPLVRMKSCLEWRKSIKRVFLAMTSKVDQNNKPRSILPGSEPFKHILSFLKGTTLTPGERRSQRILLSRNGQNRKGDATTYSVALPTDPALIQKYILEATFLYLRLMTEEMELNRYALRAKADLELDKILTSALNEMGEEEGGAFK